MQRAHLYQPGPRTVHLPIVGQDGEPPLWAPPLPGPQQAPLLPAAPAQGGPGPGAHLISTPAPEPLPPPACAYQICTHPAAAYPVVQLPPPLASPSGQPVRIVFRRTPVCDTHRHEMAASLRALLRAHLTTHFERRALPPADWDEATWEWEPVQG